MIEFFKHLFDTDGFPDRWHCGDWTAGHGWLHIISDSMIFAAYTAIPFTLLLFAWRKHREILFVRLVWLFAAFILACGLVHLIEATIFWHPWYRFSGLVKGITAAVSWATAIAIIFHMPRALNIPGLVTVNQKLESALTEQQHARWELERSNEDLDQFAYVASHDLRAPLRSIRHLASWVEEDCEDLLPEESKKHLSQLKQRVGRLDTLLTDLLTYSRAARDLNDPEPVNVAEMAENIASDILDQHSCFKIEVSPGLPEVTTWRVPLEQILRNLISNACKHHGGESGTIQVTGRAKGKNVEYSVKDDGQGISPEFHEKIFGMFQTLKSKDEVEGSGMGLAIVAKLVERIGGSISIVSKEGQGAEFIISLPATPPVNPNSGNHSTNGSRTHLASTH